MDVSILIPTYNRKKFEYLISLNICCQTYPFIKEIIIADDGNEEEILNIKCPYDVIYCKLSKRISIGQKRNFLISKASSHYIAFMDTDDFYHPDYISKSIFNLIYHDKKVSGSADMILYDKKSNKTFVQSCIFLDMLNEATLVMTRDFGLTHFFSDSMSSEGLHFLNNSLQDIYETSIYDIMICLSHSSNTIDKNIWINENLETSINTDIYEEHFKILSNLII